MVIFLKSNFQFFDFFMSMCQHFHPVLRKEIRRGNGHFDYRKRIRDNFDMGEVVDILRQVTP